MKDMFSVASLMEGSRMSTLRGSSTIKRMIDKAKPTASHEFILKLKHEDVLIRNYTQNIDCLHLNNPILGRDLLE